MVFLATAYDSWSLNFVTAFSLTKIPGPSKILCRGWEIRLPRNFHPNVSTYTMNTYVIGLKVVDIFVKSLGKFWWTLFEIEV